MNLGKNNLQARITSREEELLEICKELQAKCDSLDKMCSPKSALHVLKSWSPTGGATLGDSGNFGREKERDTEREREREREREKDLLPVCHKVSSFCLMLL
jgi:hypothetical protein